MFGVRAAFLFFWVVWTLGCIQVQLMEDILVKGHLYLLVVNLRDWLLYLSTSLYFRSHVKTRIYTKLWTLFYLFSIQVILQLCKTMDKLDETWSPLESINSFTILLSGISLA